MVCLRSIAKVSGGFVVLAALVLAGCGNRAAKLDQFGEIPSFTLTDQHGEPFSSDKTLRGKVWIADFMFTSCQAACPLMNARMNAVQAELAKEGIQLVSFTVDPEHDTPEVLDAYAKRSKAIDGVWHFLTGDPKELDDLCSDAFHLGFVDGSLEHSSKFVLVDENMQIRGYYSSLQQENIPDLVADARALLASS